MTGATKRSLAAQVFLQALLCLELLGLSASSEDLFARRFADMPWSILTPDVCAHWDGHAVSITPGIEAPGEDRLEETWRRTYASLFNPARLKTAWPR